MALVGLDLCLLASAAVFIFLDIILALCLRLVLPYHATRAEYYPADERKYYFEDAVSTCACIGGVFSRRFTDDMEFDKADFDTSDFKKRSLKERMIDRYPYLVSLSIPVFKDDSEKKMFSCNGIALNSNTVLTMKNCVLDKSEWFNLTVRSRSAYWSKYGDTHAVVEVLPGRSEFFVELKIWPEFFQSVVPKFGIRYPAEGNWTYAVKIGWDHMYYDQDPSTRFKYKIFEVEEWTTLNTSNLTSGMCYDYNKCQTMSKFLITSCYQIVGVEAFGNGCAKFLGFTNAVKRKGECKEIYLNDYSIAEREVCRLQHPML